VKRHIIAAACALALLAAGSAAASPRFGVAEDMTKYADDGGASLYPRITALGMTENRITVRWNQFAPTSIQERGFLDRSLPVAAHAGVRVVFDVYPTEAWALSVDPETRAALFAAYLQTLARTYPQVTEYIVGNEPNESYFWQPQFGPAGEQVSAAAFGRLLAVSYDALKAVNPTIRVIAAGPSNEGNDKTSTSPVRFLKALGDAYRTSGRGTPIMDALSFHVYPRTNTDPPDKPFGWPNAGGADLARIKQAVWDAFQGTAQPVFAEAPAAPEAGLRLFVDEFGWQAAIGSGLESRYSGTENVPTVSEDEQAAHYRALLRMLSCDAAVSDAMVFHLVDETDLNRFQSGLLRADLSPRPSYAAMREAIAASGSCATPVVWSHATGIAGAKAIFGERPFPARQAIFGLSAGATEDATGKAAIFRVASAAARPRQGDIDRSLAGAGGPAKPARTTVKEIKANYTPRFEFRGKLKPGHYVFAVRLTAAMNPARAQTFVSKPFRVGAAP
jgi:hypothetical protein